MYRTLVPVVQHGFYRNSTNKEVVKTWRGTMNARLLQKHSWAKGMISSLIIVLIIVPSLSVHAEAHGHYQYTEAPWKTYPYHPVGTDIVFPNDEGSHDQNQYPYEWWYANFQLIGQTGNEYGVFVSFLKIHSQDLGDKEVRLFSISDISAGNTASNAEKGTLMASNDHLDLSFEYNTNYDENSIPVGKNKCAQTELMKTTTTSVNKNTMKNSVQTDTIQNAAVVTDGNENKDGDSENLPHFDYWYTKTDGSDLLPFQYTLVVGGNAQQDSRPMSLNVDMDCLKRPLIAGGTGSLDLDPYGSSNYYSLTRVNVTGIIIVHGKTETVRGFAWVDHQWSYFHETQQRPYGIALAYEWFSLQLDHNQEILVADTWDRTTGEKIDHSVMGGLNLLNSYGALELFNDYTIVQQGTWNDTTDQCLFSSGWYLNETSKSIRLIVTPVFDDQVMRLLGNYPMLQQILERWFTAAFFWEGVCTVSGTINGEPINGMAFVELTHRYSYRGDIDFSLPNDGSIPGGSL